MGRRYRDNRTTGATASRAEARANRRLQLVHSTTHAVEHGPTLIEQMEIKLDETLKARAEKAALWNEGEQGRRHTETVEEFDDRSNKYIDWMINNEGKIQGMLVMLGIMRSTSAKVELKRARIRQQYKEKKE